RERPSNRRSGLGSRTRVAAFAPAAMIDRWERVTALFAAARALEQPLRASFLDLACPNDSGIRAEVEALLASDKDDGFLMEAPWTALREAIDASASVDSERRISASPVQPGTRMGAYEILALIGAGSMGEVYRARDANLDREVALKFLPDMF